MEIMRMVRHVVRTQFPGWWLGRARSNTFWREAEESVLSLFVDPSRASVDVGANVGRYTTALAKLSKHVYSFEPDVEHFVLLSRASPANVTVFNVGVSEMLGVVFYDAPTVNGRRNAGLGSIRVDSHLNDALGQAIVGVPLDMFEDFDIGFVKIDVEGHELSVLKGSRKLLASSKPVVLVEIEDRHNPGGIRWASDLMGSLGYSGYFLFEGRFHPLASFHEDLQREEELHSGKRRAEMMYVNNFFFVPDGHPALSALS